MHVAEKGAHGGARAPQAPARVRQGGRAAHRALQAGGRAPAAVRARVLRHPDGHAGQPVRRPGPCVVLVVLALEPELSRRSFANACPALCMAVRRPCGRAYSASAALVVAEPVGGIIVSAQSGGRALHRASCRPVVEPRRAQAPRGAPGVLETVVFARLSLSWWSGGEPKNAGERERERERGEECGAGARAALRLCRRCAGRGHSARSRSGCRHGTRMPPLPACRRRVTLLCARRGQQEQARRGAGARARAALDLAAGRRRWPGCGAQGRGGGRGGGGRGHRRRRAVRGRAAGAGRAARRRRRRQRPDADDGPRLWLGRAPRPWSRWNKHVGTTAMQSAGVHSFPLFPLFDCAVGAHLLLVGRRAPALALVGARRLRLCI